MDNGQSVLAGLGWILWVAFLVSFFGAVIMAFITLWKRQDWTVRTRTYATAALVVGLTLPPVGLMVYGVVDAATRKRLSEGQKAGWIAIIVLVPFLGEFIYFVQMLGHPEQPRPVTTE